MCFCRECENSKENREDDIDSEIELNFDSDDSDANE